VATGPSGGLGPRASLGSQPASASPRAHSLAPARDRGGQADVSSSRLHGAGLLLFLVRSSEGHPKPTAERRIRRGKAEAPAAQRCRPEQGRANH